MRHRLNPVKPFTKTNREYGGAAMEYILVSLFATFLTITALGFLGTMFQDKMGEIADKLGIQAPALSLNPFEN